MSQTKRTSRRQFLTHSAQGAALLGIGGTLGYVARNQRADDDLVTNQATGTKPAGAFQTGARRPRGIALGQDDRVYIAADQGVLGFGPDGKQLSRIEFGRPARCLATRENGDLLIGLAHHVEVVDAHLVRKAAWPSLGKRSLITGVAVAGDETFVADRANRLLCRCDAAGNVLTRFRPDAAGFASLAEFFSLAASDGLLHVANPLRHRIETYTSDGEFVSAWGKRSRHLAGFSGCCNPVSFAVLSDGRFVTAERGQPRVKLYDASGQFVSLLAGPERFAANARASAGDNGDGCQTGGFDVAIDSGERVLILDRVTGEVHIMV